MLTTEALIQRLNVLGTPASVRTLVPDTHTDASARAGLERSVVRGATAGRWATFCWLHASAAWIRSWRAYMLAALQSAPGPDGGADPGEPPERL